MAIDLGDMPKGTPPTPQQQAQIRSSIGLGSSGSAGFSSLVLTGQSVTGTAANSLLDMTTTWNTNGIPSAIKLNVNDVESNVNSNLLDLKRNNVTQFKVDRSGNIVFSTASAYQGAIHIGSYGFGVGSNSYIAFSNNANGAGSSDLFISRKTTANLRLGLADAAAPVAQTLSVQSVIAGTINTAGTNFTIDGSQGTGTGAGGSIIFRTAKATTSSSTVNSLTGAMSINSNGLITLLQAQTGTGGLDLNGYGLITSFDWQLRNTNGFIGLGATSSVADTRLYRDTFYTLALRNSSNAQTFRIYNTYTDDTRFERLNIKWDTSVIKIGTEKGSAGGSACPMEFQTDGVTRMTIAAGGAISLPFGSTITVASDINGQRDIYCGSGRYFRFNVAGYTGISSSALGVMTLEDLSAVNLSPRINLGGLTSSFPAIKRNGAALQIRLADDSANAALETAGLTVVGSASVSGHFSAATKSFLIDHPTKAGKKLQYGVVESNQHSVLVRGKTAESIIELPEEWAGLVHEDSVTVQLTPIDSYQSLFVISQDNQKVVVGGSSGQYNYTIYGERKDVDKLVTEI